MDAIARYLMLAGVILLFAGLVLFVIARLDLPLGRLPGDFRFSGDNYSFYLPCATSILLSIALTFILNIVLRFLNK